MNTAEYLSRIGFLDGNPSADLDNLRKLQHAHLLAVPFENLDIHWKHPITLDTDRFFEKIVVGRRGGFCYELNGLFNQLLRSLGFTTRLVSARVFNNGAHGPEFDHAAIIVTLDGHEYLVDVGFGAFTAEPLRFVIGEKQQDMNGIFVVRKFDNKYVEVAKLDDGEWRSEYIFTDLARELEEFSEMCDFQQYSPESHFTKGKLCSLMTESGRKTLTDKSFLVTSNGRKVETPLNSDSEFYGLLASEFGIEAASS